MQNSLMVTTQMSKHEAVYIIQRDTVVIYNCALVGWLQ